KQPEALAWPDAACARDHRTRCAHVLCRANHGIAASRGDDAGELADVGQVGDSALLHAAVPSIFACFTSRSPARCSPLALRCARTALSSTLMIGPIEASARMPKPSIACVALPRPRPIASTSGTVIGPVVTPALSQATLTKASEDTAVSRIASR